jgi:perosamine synthetase
MAIPLFKIFWDKDDIEMVNAVIRSGSYWTTGPTVEKFEEQLAGYAGTKYCATFNSGTSALHALLMAYGLGSGDEVIVPSFTFIATANAPLFVGARPAFADIEEGSYCLDPASVQEKITKKTRAVIPIDYGGCPCDIKAMREIARDNNLLFIEDAAEAFGAKTGGQVLGHMADATLFSFCQNKIITTGEGGCIVTDDKKIADRLKLIRSHGRDDGPSNYFSKSGYSEYVTLGFNFRMSDITAASGISQLKKVEQIVDMRRSNAAYYSGRLGRLDGIVTPASRPGDRHVYQLYTIRLTAPGKSRDELSGQLMKNGISNKVYFYPVHLTEFYRRDFGWKAGDLPVTEVVSQQVLTLPMYPELTHEEMDRVIACIESYMSA